jgi:hypothetical protein
VGFGCGWALRIFFEHYTIEKLNVNIGEGLSTQPAPFFLSEIVCMLIHTNKSFTDLFLTKNASKNEALR